MKCVRLESTERFCGAVQLADAVSFVERHRALEISDQALGGDRVAASSPDHLFQDLLDEPLLTLHAPDIATAVGLPLSVDELLVVTTANVRGGLGLVEHLTPCLNVEFGDLVASGVVEADLDTSQRADDLLEACEVDFGHVVDGNVEVLLNGTDQAVDALCVGAVDPVVLARSC